MPITELCISALLIMQPSEIMDWVILHALMIDPGKKKAGLCRLALFHHIPTGKEKPI